MRLSSEARLGCASEIQSRTALKSFVDPKRFLRAPPSLAALSAILAIAVSSIIERFPCGLRTVLISCGVQRSESDPRAAANQPQCRVQPKKEPL